MTSFIERKTRFKVQNSDKSFEVLFTELSMLLTIGVVEWDTNTSKWVTDLTTTQMNALLFELRNQ